VKCQRLVKSCKIFLFQKNKPFKNILLVSICTIVWWDKNVKSIFQELVLMMTIAFESFIGLGGPSHDQMIRNKKKQKMIAIIRAIKDQI
jgi:hypothetical protein